MASHRSDGFWQSVRALPGRMPLRTKLIAAVLALVAVALVVISTAGLIILRNDLLGPYDSALQSPGTLQQADRAVTRYLESGQTFQGVGQVAQAVDWISGGHIHRVVIPVTGYNQPSIGGLPQPSEHTVPGPTVSTNSGWLAANADRILTVPAQTGSGRWRVLLQPVNGTVSGTIIVGSDVTNVYTTIGQLFDIDLLVSIAVICVLGLVVVAVIRRSLRPLIDIERTAGAIAAGELSRRVPERDPRTEVGRLGRSLNVMLSHIESAFSARSKSEAAARHSEEKLRQFVADASHELRTPLTAIRGFAEYYRQRGGVAAGGSGSGQLAGPDMDRIMRRVEQESARMGILVEDMLLLARLDQQRPLEAKPVDLLTLAADAVHDARVVAPGRSIQLTVGSGAALIIIGDEVRLRQVIGNLMTNALTHTPAGTPIDVRIRSGSLDEAPEPAQSAPASPRAALPPPSPPSAAMPPPPPPSAATAFRPFPASARAATAGPAVAASPEAQPRRAHRPAAVLEVADQGPGLSREQAKHVFERFYRADPARTVGGTGLGLAIVAALVAAHGGASWVESTPGRGATFRIALPLAPEAAQDSDEDDDISGPDWDERDNDADWHEDDDEPDWEAGDPDDDAEYWYGSSPQATSRADRGRAEPPWAR
jgi:two-component system, OmpR family, sensor kinase